MGGSLAGYFGVFHRLMAAKLREAAAAADERALEALARGLKEDCCASQHTYVHAQQVGWVGGIAGGDLQPGWLCFGVAHCPRLAAQRCSSPQLPWMHPNRCCVSLPSTRTAPASAD